MCNPIRNIFSVEKAKATVLKKKNIVVCGYPKSGTTWATRLVAQLLDCQVKGYWGVENEAISSEGSERESDFVCYHAHQYLEDLSRESTQEVHKIVYIVRDPRDVVVSGVYHFSFYHKVVAEIEKIIGAGKIIYLFKQIDKRTSPRRFRIERMMHMLFKGDPNIDHCNYIWEEHIKSYKDKPNVLFLRYEDLLHHGLDSSVKILNHCGTTKDLEAVKNDIHEQSFSIRKKQFKQSNDKVREKHLRSGVSGGWKKELDLKHIQLIEGKLDPLMKELKYL